MKQLLTVAAVPLLALGTALPARALPSSTQGTGWAPANTGQRVSATAVTGVTLPKAAPLRQVRSSSVKCSGTVIARSYAKVGKTTVGELTLYVVAANKQTAIACFKHVGPTKGVTLPTSVALVASKSAKASPVVAVTAYGNFRSWAGPAAIGGVGVKGQCVAAAGVMKYKGKNVTAQTELMCKV